MTEAFEPQPEELPEAEAGELSEAERLHKLNALEAVLFMAAEPLEPKELADILEVSSVEMDNLIYDLEQQYAYRGLQLNRIAGGYQVVTRPEYGSIVARLHKPERFRLSRAALETLAIVAYRQPVTRPEIESIRGVNSDSPLDTLVQYELVCEAGRKDAPGRPVLYCTTDNFLGHFGLNSIADLPGLDTIPVEMPEEALAPAAAEDASPVPEGAEGVVETEGMEGVEGVEGAEGVDGTEAEDTLEQTPE
jgi:segregation and condensation protein B